MNDTAKSVPLSTIALYGLWVWVFVTLTASWVTMVAGWANLGRGFGFTACVSSAVAVAVTNRCYTSRVCRLMRVLNDIESPHPAELHRVP